MSSARLVHNLGRDAILASLVSPGKVARLLGRYAHQYGVRPGDGEQLLDQLLDNAGLPTNVLELAARVQTSPERRSSGPQ